MKKIVVGVLAHVDAGKTTLSEGALYLSGKIRQLGRVDHQNTSLDYDPLERHKGITIFSKQTYFHWKDTMIMWLDTPGHTDFSSEMERTLQILDYAVLVMSGRDGVQSHTKTIWKLLQRYHVPTFVFVNKMDLAFQDEQTLLEHLQSALDSHCLNFSSSKESLDENVALYDEALLESYLEKGTLSSYQIATMIEKRNIYPCFFGSALKMQGIESFLDGLDQYTLMKDYPDTFGAKVYKITHDNKGQRLTHLKITGGTLSVKERLGEEKVDQIRLYSGGKFETVDQVSAGMVCAIQGLKHAMTGMGLGYEQQVLSPVLSSYRQYRLVLPSSVDPYQFFDRLKILAQEDPLLQLRYDTRLKEIQLSLMGEIQIEVLKNRILELFGIQVDFEQRRLLYKETIEEPVEGVGHYEPLRHYAEVHLLLKPGPRGSGLQFESRCKEDDLALHWQRLVLTHLQEKEHIGVLTGSPITDMKITLIAGKAHLKHTEGGDFREATYRALRQGLKKAKSILLEPFYHFELTIPSDCLSKAIFDLEKMEADFTIPEVIEDMVTLQGEASVASMEHYHQEVMSYTKGLGKLMCTLSSYQPCLHAQAIIEDCGYDSESDLENPTGSVFCSHGAGFTVAYDEVEKYMHIHTPYSRILTPKLSKTSMASYTLSGDEEAQLEAIFQRTYGPIKQPLSRKAMDTQHLQSEQKTSILKECLLVDGYNVIHAWKDLSILVEHDLDVARSRLIDILSNYQGYRNCLLIIVFDAYKVKGNIGSVHKEGNVYVIYTKEAQTADMYIERVSHELAKQYRVVVATSDALEQLIVIGQGASRISSRELELEVQHTLKEQFSEFERKHEKFHAYPLEDMKDKYSDES